MEQVEAGDELREVDDVADGRREVLGELLPLVDGVASLGARVEGTRLGERRRTSRALYSRHTSHHSCQSPVRRPSHVMQPSLGCQSHATRLGTRRWGWVGVDSGVRGAGTGTHQLRGTVDVLRRRRRLADHLAQSVHVGARELARLAMHLHHALQQLLRPAARRRHRRRCVTAARGRHRHRAARVRHHAAAWERRHRDGHLVHLRHLLHDLRLFLLRNATEADGWRRKTRLGRWHAEDYDTTRRGNTADDNIWCVVNVNVENYDKITSPSRDIPTVMHFFNLRQKKDIHVNFPNANANWLWRTPQLNWQLFMYNIVPYST